MTTTEALESQAICRVIIKSVQDGRVEVAVPETDYLLSLCAVGNDDLGSQVGRRQSGVIRARALRIHAAAGGGQFIEPVAGEPRILAGRLMSVDAATKTLLVRAAVPMLVHAEENHDLSAFQPGQLLTFYVESGTSFTPVAE